MPKLRKPLRRSSHILVAAPRALPAATLRAIRTKLGPPFIEDSALDKIFDAAWKRHQLFVEEIDRAPRPLEMALAWEELGNSAHQIALAAGSFNESGERAATVAEQAKAEAARLRSLPAVRRDKHAGLRNTLLVLSLQLVQAHSEASKLTGLPIASDMSPEATKKRLMDAMRIGLKGLGIAINFEKNPARYYNLL